MGAGQDTVGEFCYLIFGVKGGRMFITNTGTKGNRSILWEKLEEDFFLFGGEERKVLKFLPI